MTTTSTKKSPRDRILETACDLFYRQGYHATGINQIIAESKVAKATFYDHFSSKEKLLYDYVCEMSQREFTEFRGEVDSFDTAEKRFFGPLNILIPWLTSTGFRGCPFQNVVSEIPPGDKRIQRIIRKHHDRQREFLKELCAAYVAERPEYNEVDCDALAETYGLLFDGAIASAAAYRDVRPVEKAIATLKIVLGRNA